ncbi:raffinose/stachyose/melibiose transport system substrate-binding protein [Paenibacillus sophorae]|uniref:ABC transporter substrate-binding protein n=1 Tax=Paenibacillus sophorae TaxID=1333845 RepID=A0A1H8U4L8_9BACL|nr:ABC transporter substrate-binding protein [Paenibacillus sophorae]QWU17934.1 ABC transporter substrate-binding protein [Paenibacillus sophorae]SEO97784.1 raffinose/stachyose/melibiose transport system substrate-binding protein [Paenibacillus sophorae]
MKKTLALFLVLLLVASLTACGGSGNSDNTAAESNGGKVNIVIVNGKGEIASQWEQAAKDFMAANPDITVEAVSGAVGETVNLLDKLTASGKTVTLAMMSPDSIVNKYKDFGIDLSGEKWNQDTVYGVKDANGKVAGFPFSIEGFGLVYNKSVVEKAVGGTFDPYSINTRDKLKALLDKIQASGVKYPVAYQTENWSVANHYSTQFLNQAEDPNTIVEQLKAGTFDLASNAVWNGYYDTMDLLVSKTYNKYGERPLGKYYDDAHLSVGKGESAILFNGNWAFDSLKAVSGESFGFIPVPVDNNPDNPLNNKIAAGPTNILVINKAATTAQQEAAKKFLDWLVYDQKGQDFLVNQAQVISAFKNNPNKVTNPLGVAIAEAVQAGKTLPFSSNYVKVEDWGNILAPDIQKYIAQKESRADLAKAIETYYKNQQ